VVLLDHLEVQGLLVLQGCLGQQVTLVQPEDLEHQEFLERREVQEVLDLLVRLETVELLEILERPVLPVPQERQVLLA
jgi:hypothetical protein